MKTFTLVVFTTLLSIGKLQAQTQLSIPLQKQLNMALSGNAHVMQKIFTKAYNKIQPRTAQMSRLIASAEYSYIGEKYQPVDSNLYAYTRNNGGDLDSEYIKYTTENMFYYSLKDSMYSDDTMSRQTFDANDNIDSMFYYVWDTKTSTWENLYLSYYEYNNNNDTLELDYEWDNGKWLLEDKAESYYAGNVNDSEIVKLYDNGTSKYTNYYQYFTTFTDSDTTSSFEIWNTANSSWNDDENFREIVYHNDTSYIAQSYNTGDSMWVNEDREIPLPIVSGKQIYYEFTWSGSTWDTSGEEIAYYDGTNDTTILELEYTSGTWTNDAKYTYQYNGFNEQTYFSQLSYSRVSSEYIPVSEDFYYYQNYPSGINPVLVNNNKLSVFPNPTSGEITIISSKNIDNLKVTNLLGQLVYESYPGQAQFTFEIKDAGMYFVTVTTGNQITTSKVIVNR